MQAKPSAAEPNGAGRYQDNLAAFLHEPSNRIGNRLHTLGAHTAVQASDRAGPQLNDDSPRRFQALFAFGFHGLTVARPRQLPVSTTAITWLIFYCTGLGGSIGGFLNVNGCDQHHSFSVMQATEGCFFAGHHGFESRT